MHFIVLAYALAAIAIMTGISDVNEMYAIDDRNAEDHLRIETVGNALNRFILTQGSLPADLPTLVATPGYELLSTYITPDMGYQVATITSATTDSRYQKAIVFYQDNKDETATNFLSSNNCGVGSFSTTVEWCKRDGSIYTVVDERAHQKYLAKETVSKLTYLSQQFFNAYSSSNAFPRIHDSGTLNDGDLISLPAAIGYAGTAAACTGVYNFDGAAITCELMFGVNGTPVQYILEDNNNVIVYVTMPYTNAVGNAHVIARPLRIL